jgi:predicted DCC family thiol-disulfide oxidoreductase YuxK
MAGPLLFYDGTCGFCARMVQFALRHEGARHDLRFAPLDSGPARALRAHRAIESIDSFIWSETTATGEVVLVRSDAGLALASYLGGGWRMLALLARIFPRRLRDTVYDLLARHRHALGGAVCLVPTPEQRARFLGID